MEQFALAAAHSGSIHHVHSFVVPPATAQALRELRLAVTALALAWVAVTAVRAVRRGRGGPAVRG